MFCRSFLPISTGKTNQQHNSEQDMADVDDNRPIDGKMDDGSEEEEEDSPLKRAKQELETWKAKVENANDVKSKLILEKIEEDTRTKAQEEMFTYSKRKEEHQDEFTQSMNAIQNEILKLEKCRQDLMDELRRRNGELEERRAESTKLKQKFKIYIEIPITEISFSGQNEEEGDDDSQLIRGVFAISQRPSVLLQGGQALITFEEERVACQILKMAKCPVSCDNGTLAVKPKILTMDPVTKFEVHLDVSRKELNIYNILSSMPDERIKDRLEMSFSRPSRGGGELEKVEYDRNTGTGRITFLQPGVAESLALIGRYLVNVESKVNVKVGPVYKHHLQKFQTFCGSSTRTILLDGIKDVEDEEDLQYHLQIHFQKPNNYGGEIAHIKYTSGGKALQAFFLCEDTAEMDK